MRHSHKTSSTSNRHEEQFQIVKEQLRTRQVANRMKFSRANRGHWQEDVESNLSDEEDFTAEINQVADYSATGLGLFNNAEEDVPMPALPGATEVDEDDSRSESSELQHSDEKDNSRSGRMSHNAIQSADELESDAKVRGGNKRSSAGPERETDERSQMDVDRNNETTPLSPDDPQEDPDQVPNDTLDDKMKTDKDSGIKSFPIESSDVKMLSPPNQSQGWSHRRSVQGATVAFEGVTDLSPQSLFAAVNRMSATLFDIKDKVEKIEVDVEELKDGFPGVPEKNQSQNEGLNAENKHKHPADKIQHRPAQQVKISGIIRELVRKLMKLSDKRSQLPSLPAKQQIKLHAKGVRGYGPSLDNFVIDYVGQPQSPWNLACRELFLKYFIEQGYGTITRDKKIIEKAFDTRFHSLRRDYKNMNKYRRNKSAKGIDQSNAARRKRKLAKYRRRIAVVKGLPKSAPFAPYFCRLTVDGMSSDESDYEDGGTIVYRKTKKDWRSKELGLWLQDLDNLHLATRDKPMGQFRKGAMPHKELQGTAVSERKHVIGLPKNFYSSRWLSGLDRNDQETLDLQPSQPFPGLTEEVARLRYRLKIDAKKRRNRGAEDLEEDGNDAS